MSKVLKRRGLTVPRRRRRRAPAAGIAAPFSGCEAANAVWCIDFKGHFAVGGGRCHPLTITDAHTRYLIACVALNRPDGLLVQRAMWQVFDEFGLPAAIRSDNGTVHVSDGLARTNPFRAW